MKRRTSLAGLLVVLGIIALTAPPVGAGSAPPIDVASLLPAPALARLGAVRAEVREVRRALAAPAMGDRIAGLLSAAGAAPVAPELPAPGPEDLGATAFLPPDVQAPVAGLLAAVRRAIEMIGPLPPDAIRRSAPILADLGRPRILPGPERGGVRAPAPAPARRDLDPALAAAAARAPVAAILLGAALDRYLPALRPVSPSRGGAGCDIAEQPPLLCIASDVDTTHTEDFALIIDLGGDDTYLNGAGTAPFLPSGSPAAVPVSVVADLAGDDRYVAAAPTSALLPDVIAQGVGMFGGVGMLVDVEGDDVYEARALVPEMEEETRALAQGVGLAGIGLLLDGSGSDRYTVEGPSGTGDWVTVVGQGTGLFTLPATAPPRGATYAVGALVDAGSGDDAYRLDAGTVTGPGGHRSVAGQGFGSAALGVLADDGGTDGFEALAGAVSEALPRSSAFISAQGLGIGFFFAAAGMGLLLEGAGPTSYRIEAGSGGIAWNSVEGQGNGRLSGVGVLDDMGGDDSYSVQASLEHRLDIVVDDPCTVVDQGTGQEEPCQRAEATASMTISSTINQVKGQGHGSTEGFGLLEDRGGDDAYRAVAAERFEVRLEDRLNEPSGPPVLNVYGYPTNLLYAQGEGDVASVGILVDAGGTDRYEMRSVDEVHGEATSEHAEGSPVVTAFSPGRAFIAGQGAGDFIGLAGALLDLGGAGDRFTGSATNPATVSPAPGRPYSASGLWPYFHGAFGGVFAALGQDPVIISGPSRPVCLASLGVRGFGEWSDCAVQDDDPEHQNPGGFGGVTGGLAPRAAGGPPSLAFTADTPAGAAAEDWVGAGATLRDPAGQPIEGATLHFDLQYRGHLQEPTGGVVDGAVCCWRGIWEVDAVTGPDGVARVVLPTDVDPSFCSGPCSYRLLVTFDGGRGLYPRHTARALDLQVGGESGLGAPPGWAGARA